MSTIADQRSVNVTIYNDGNALVHDRRTIALQTGLNRIAWRDVSASLDSNTAALNGVTPADTVSVVEQNFNYDVLNGDSLLHAYLGHWVTVVHPARFAGERDHRERAKILSLDNGIVLQYADRIETHLDGFVDFASVPASLRDRPTLTLDVQAPRAGTRNLDLAYLTSGMTWNVNYIATLNAGQSTMSLLGLVTLNNTSGTSYRNARLQLVAGSVHQAPAATPAPLQTIARVSTADSYNVNAQQQDLFEYHLYTIGYRTTILDKQTKQLALLSAHDVPVTKTLELRGGDYYYRARYPDLGERLPLQVFVSFVNKGGDLGIPLPAGVLRVYQNDTNGLAQYIGADSVGHTPKNDTVRLNLGEAFDVVARKKQTDFSLVSNCEARSSYEIALRNAKDVAQNVTIVEPIFNDWHITRESVPHQKSSSTTATWNVMVPPEGESVLTYTADVTWCR